MPTIIKSMKYEIIRPVSCEWPIFQYILKTLQQESFRLKNRVVQYCYQQEFLPVAPTDKPFRTWLYQVISDEFGIVHAKNLTSTVTQAERVWHQSRQAVLAGRQSFPSFRNTNPILLHKASIRHGAFVDHGRHVELELSLLSRVGQQWVRSLPHWTEEQRAAMGTTYTVRIHAGRNLARHILEQWINGETPIRESSIVYQETKHKWFLNLTYAVESSQLPHDSRVLGVRMADPNRAVMVVSDRPDWSCVIEGSAVKQHHLAMESKRRRLQRQIRVCGSGRTGHGRKKRLEPLTELEDKVSRFRAAVNHTYARRIVDTAVRLGCSSIRMDDLSLRSSGSAFLGAWTYFDLQMQVLRKAADKGIDVVKMDPRILERQCSQCGAGSKSSGPNYHCEHCDYQSTTEENALRNLIRLPMERLPRGEETR